MQRRNHGDKHVSYHDNLYETTTHDLLVITTHFLGVVVATVETTTVCYSTQRRRVVVLLGAIGYCMAGGWGESQTHAGNFWGSLLGRTRITTSAWTTKCLWTSRAFSLPCTSAHHVVELHRE